MINRMVNKQLARSSYLWVYAWYGVSHFVISVISIEFFAPFIITHNFTNSTTISYRAKWLQFQLGDKFRVIWISSTWMMCVFPWWPLFTILSWIAGCRSSFTILAIKIWCQICTLSMRWAKISTIVQCIDTPVAKKWLLQNTISLKK